MLPGVAEQVVEVPKILRDNIPQRAGLQEPQTADQLGDVPQISPRDCVVMGDEDTPVSSSRRSTAFGGAHQGLHPGQGSTAFGGAELLGLPKDTAPLRLVGHIKVFLLDRAPQR